MNRKKFDVQDEIDLLAAGEMAFDEREKLFDKLDRDPTDWKRCALALLENRALQNSFAGDFGLHENELGSETKEMMAAADPRTNSSWKTWLMMATAACLFVTVGLAVGLNLNVDRPSRTVVMSESHTDEPAHQIEPNSKDLIRQVKLAMNATGVDDFELVAFVGVQDSLRTRVYPIIKSLVLEEKMALLPKPDFGSEVAQQLRRAGWKFSTHRQFVSFDLPNGKKETLPVGMLNCRFVGPEMF